MRIESPTDKLYLVNTVLKESVKFMITECQCQIKEWGELDVYVPLLLEVFMFGPWLTNDPIRLAL